MTDSRHRNGRKRGSAHSADGRFVKGNPGGPGRPPGSQNLRTLAGRELLKALEAGDPRAGLPAAFDRMTRLLTDPDPRVRLGTERLVMSLLHGRSASGEFGAEDGDGPTRPDPEAVALRLVNFVAGALAKGAGTDETAPLPDTHDDPLPAA